MIEAGSLDRLTLGDHACVIVDDDRERLRALAAFIAAGLRDNHRILYFGPLAEGLGEALAAHGRDLEAALSAGRLRVSTPEESYLASGTFDPDATLEGWRRESAAALDAGFRGLRAIGDMSWASRPVSGRERLAWYEAHVNRVFAEGSAMAMCLYDRRLFSRAELQPIVWAHPATVASGVDPQTVPLLRAVHTEDPPGLRLTGEADLSNRDALRAVVANLAEDLPAGAGPLVVDIAGLRFLDAAAVRLLIDVATGLTPIRVTGCSPGVQRLLTASGAAAVPGLTVEPAVPVAEPAIPGLTVPAAEPAA
jgi:anti-anti-sigma factor